MSSRSTSAKGFNDNSAFSQAFVERLGLVRVKKNKTMGLTLKFKSSRKEQILVEVLKKIKPEKQE